VTSNLTRGEIRKVSKALRGAGKKLPARGRCVYLSTGPGSSKRAVPWPDRYVAEVCNDGRGYYFVRSTTALEGYRKRRRR